ncbi:MAG: citrate/2-methylcitrate synthase, partial [Elusimicrobiota bacterium]
MSETAEIKFNGQSYKLPVSMGSEGEKGLDIRALRETTGFVTLDPSFANTASCTSAITYIDGENGILRYRGIPIEELAVKSTFLETSYLLIYGRLPSADELSAFSTLITRHTLLHEDMKNFFLNYPPTAHPMAILSAMVCSLS